MIPAPVDVFVSYRTAGSSAEWVRGVLVPALDAAGYGVVVDTRSFGPGEMILDDMERASAAATVTVAVVDDDYLISGFTTLERHAARYLVAVHRGIAASSLPASDEVVDMSDPNDFAALLAAIERGIKRVFVLDAKEDEEWVEGMLIPALARAGVRARHTGDIEAGAHWLQQVERAIQDADRVVVVLSSAYLRDMQPRVDRLVVYTDTLTHETDRKSVV